MESSATSYEVQLTGVKGQDGGYAPDGKRR
jgi:hypothetical protein